MKCNRTDVSNYFKRVTMNSKLLIFVLSIGLISLFRSANAKPRDVGVQQNNDGLIQIELQKEEIKPNPILNPDQGKDYFYINMFLYFNLIYLIIKINSL